MWFIFPTEVMMYKLLIVNILTTIIAVIQSEDSEPDWKPIEWTIPVDYTTPTPVDFAKESILLRTGTDGGVDKALLISFNNVTEPVGIAIMLDQDNPGYYLEDCSWSSFPAAIPAPDQNGYRIFRIEDYRFYGLKISCNDEVILSFLPSKMECDYSRSEWTKWLQQKRGIRFKVWHDTKPAFIQYAVVPREDEEDRTIEEDTMTNDIDMEWSWTPLFTYKGPIPLDLDTTDVLLKIGKRGIGRKQLRMDFWDAEGNKAGGFRLTMFEKNPMYEFINCTSSEYVAAAQTNLPDLPEPDENGDRIFKIERYRYYGLQVSCNGDIILNFQPSQERCPGHSYYYRDTYYDLESWIADVKKITFDFIYFSGAESYYALVPRGIDITTDSPVNSTSKEESNEKTASDDILSCFQCEEIILTDKEGNKLEIPADLKAAVNPRPCTGSNKTCPGEEFDACLDYVVKANLTGRDRLQIIQKDCIIREPLEHDNKYIHADAYDKICKLGIKAELKHILGIAHYYVSCSWESICSEDSCNNKTAYLELDMASHGATISYVNVVITAAVAMLVFNF